MPPPDAHLEPFVPDVIPPAWQSLREATCSSGSVLVLVGRPDVGKTTLAFYLAREAVNIGRPVGLLDADVGQSVVGPPTTVGLKLLREGLWELTNDPDALYFVGTTSPAETAAEMVAGTRRLVDLALARGAALVIVDTTGLVDGPVGYRLKTAKIDAVHPDHLIAIESAAGLGELRHILRRYTTRDDVHVHRLVASADARTVSRATRRRLRAAAFSRYLSDATACELRLSDLALCGTPLLEPAAGLEGTVVGFLDGEGLTTGIGVVERLDADAGLLCVRASARLVEAARAIQLSRCRVPEAAEAAAASDAADATCRGSPADSPGTEP